MVPPSVSRFPYSTPAAAGSQQDMQKERYFAPMRKNLSKSVEKLELRRIVVEKTGFMTIDYFGFSLQNIAHYVMLYLSHSGCCRYLWGEI